MHAQYIHRADHQREDAIHEDEEQRVFEVLPARFSVGPVFYRHDAFLQVTPDQVGSEQTERAPTQFDPLRERVPVFHR